jgi:hypothetical protein
MEPDAIYEAFSANGYCVVDSLFDPDELDRIKEKALENFNEIMGIITAKGLSFGVGLKEGYDEVVQRQAGRYEVPYKMNDSFHALASNEKLLEIVHRILGDDIKIVNESLIISMQGTTVSIRIKCHLLFITLIFLYSLSVSIVACRWSTLLCLRISSLSLPKCLYSSS